VLIGDEVPNLMTEAMVMATGGRW